MDNSHNVTELYKLENPLNKLQEQDAQLLLAQAIEAEVKSLLNNFTSLQANGMQGVVRNGHLPDQHLQTWLSHITIKVPKVEI
ncbi:hypothetical protein [Candidatus Enterovibrio escicola]|uniref:hypothetical protein n=1 Tax=Candidatus Enterovibrio escicola TaxID=1927127 RepID=UPI001237A33D|nr:hypothetical protein [Candidatus Enterovibrio escacola]